MIEFSPFTLPFALVVVVMLQFISAFLAMLLRKPLLPIVSTGILTGMVAACLIFQALPGQIGMPVASIAGVFVGITYTALMDKVWGRLIRQ